MAATLDKDLTSNETYFDDDSTIEDTDFVVMINADGYSVNEVESGEPFNVYGDYNFE